MKELEWAKTQLLSEGYTYVLCKGRVVYTSTERGVKPLVALIEKGLNLDDFCAADKVIGKATAFLYILLGVKEVYASVISMSALSLLRDHGIFVIYEELVEHIINRRGDGICPFEAAVLDVQDANRAYDLILGTMEKMNIMH